MDETRAFFELLGMLVTDPRTAVLLVLLAAAAVWDYRTYRIPNLITGCGIVFALVYNGIVPPEWHTDWTWAPAGMLLGFFALLPMYAIRVMGAGDVKLMAMVGAFLGLKGTAYALLFCVVTGGLASLAFAVHKGVLLRMLANTRDVLRGMLWSTVAGSKPGVQQSGAPSVGKLAYGVSIAIGTTAYVFAAQFGLI